MACGIYKIENKLNGKIYVGSSYNIKKRWKQHTSRLKKNKHINNHLQRAWNKYGEKNFEFSVIEECIEDKLIEREQYWADYYKSQNIKLYNVGEFVDSPIRGRHHTEEVKKKMSEAKKGKTYEELYGIERANEMKQNLSEKLSGKLNHFYGRRHSKKTKKLISEHHADFSGENAPLYKKISKQNQEEICALYLSGKGTEEIGKIYNFYPQVINRILKKNHIIIRSISESHKYKKLYECPHCHKIMDKAHYIQYDHGDNCRQKSISNE